MGLSNDHMLSAAQTFLKTGETGDLDGKQLVSSCDKLVRQTVEQSSQLALLLSKKFVSRCARMDARSRATSLRARGWACLVAGRYDEAERAYLAARKLVRRDSMARARIDRALIDIYMYKGQPAEALRRSRMAMATFRRLKADADLAKTRVNYANVLHRQDRHREAAERYELAAQYFEAVGQDFPAAICYYNLANSLVQLFDFDSAEKLYEQAREVLKAHDQQLRATGCDYGLAWLYMLRGDLHIALEKLTACERWYEQAGQRRELLLCRLDRAEVYLALNLFVDARNLAEEAEDLARKLGIRYEAAKAAFFSSKASWAMGRRTEARRAIQRAAAGFRAETNRPFLAATQLTRSMMSDNLRSRKGALRAARRQFACTQLPLWEAICDLQLAGLNEHPESVLTRLRKNPAVKSVPFLFASWHTLLGDRQAAGGNSPGAVEHWSIAAATLDAVRAKLPPVDMRTSFGRQEINPYPRLINEAAERDPEQGAVLAERHRTIGVWAPLEQSRADSPALERARQSLSLLAGRFSSLSVQLKSAGKRQHSESGDSDLQQVVDRVRHDLSVLQKDSVDRRSVATPEDFHWGELLSRQSIVQFHLGPEDIIAFVHENGETRCHRYTDGARTLEQLASGWRFLVERQAARPSRFTDYDLADERMLLESIGSWLWSPLEIDSDVRHLAIVAEGALCNLPWHAVISAGQHLYERHSLVFAPSVRHLVRASQVATRSRKVEVFVGDTHGLKLAKREPGVFEGCAGWAVTTRARARRGDWPHNSRAAVWHFTGHAQLRRDNPFYSALQMVDGPMFAADFRLLRNTVNLIALAGCQTGAQAHLPAEESTGLVRSLLEMGARNVLASHWSVWDTSSLLWVEQFYDRYLRGTPLNQSAHAAMQAVREKHPGAYHWAAYSIFGAGR